MTDDELEKRANDPDADEDRRGGDETGGAGAGIPPDWPEENEPTAGGAIPPEDDPGMLGGGGIPPDGDDWTKA
jgi:hypothetical protein